jgi:hypothetical protein
MHGALPPVYSVSKMWCVINLFDSFIFLYISMDLGPMPPKFTGFPCFWLLFAEVWWDLLEEDLTFVLYLL